MGGVYDELRVALHAVWTRRWLALAAAWAICLAGWLVVSQIPNRYESVARVQVDISTVLQDKVGISGQEQQRAVDRVRQTLASAVNLEKVVRGTDLANTVATDRDVADRVAGLQKSIKVVADADNLVVISATAGSPKLARAIVQKLIDIFVEQNMAGSKEENAATLQFLDQQLAERQRQLAAAEAQRANFQSNVLGSLPGTGSVADRVGAARTQIAQIDQDLATAQAALSAVNGQMAGTSASVAGSYSAGPARARLSAIQGQINEARVRGYTDAHPDMIALRGQLAAAQSAAAREPLSGGGGSANPVYLQLRSMQAERAATVNGLQMKRAQVQASLDNFQQRIDADPAVAGDQDKAERDYQVLKDGYDKLLADREDIRLRGQVQSQTSAIKFAVTDPPTAPRTPTAPNRPLLLTGVLIAGLAGGIGAAFLLGQLRTTFATAGRLERAAGMPVIGAIGEVVTLVQRLERRRKLRWFAGGLAGLAAAYVALIGVEFVQRGMMA